MTTRPLIVLGAQRSGTTIVARLLADHPDVFLTVNGKLLYYLIAWVYRSGEARPGLHLRLDEIVHSLGRKPIMGVPPETVEGMLRTLATEFKPERFAGASAAEIVRTIWSETCAPFAEECSVVGDKYNEYLLQLREIRELYPEARFLFLHRDPYAVGESMIRAFRGRPWAPVTPSVALTKWAEWNQQWLAVRGEIDPANRLEVAYEDVVADARQAFASICRFLDIPAERTYLDIVAASIDRGRASAASTAAVRAQMPSDPALFAAVSEQLGYHVSAREDCA